MDPQEQPPIQPSSPRVQPLVSSDSSPPIQQVASTPTLDVSSNNQPATIEVSNSVPQYPNKRQKSVVWNHFDKCLVNNETKAQCRYCKKQLGGKSKNGTSHLHDHLKVCLGKNQPDIKQKILLNNSKGDMTSRVYEEKEGRETLAKMIVLHEYPLSIVDHVGFRTFTTTIQPLFKCPSRNTVKNDILKIYEKERNEVIKRMESEQSRVSITTDMWTSGSQKKGFMAITAHFIDKNWVLQSKILRFAYVPCPHTSDALTEVLMDAFMEWNIDTKLCTITVDNCTTNDSLIEVIKSAIENVRDSVAFWTATPKRTALMYKDVFARLFQRESQYKSLPTQVEWENAKEICKRLESPPVAAPSLPISWLDERADDVV
ncbi:zinc finger BED domain-containing protein RICESLEEPER 2-like [Curcuma longa]|uniref:zinc finger BED domain-containing protein RICESLEEPER 2-like n=1 Tax=Curcuma longa TaxID=136217 RepID=UPI003D9E5E40